MSSSRQARARVFADSHRLLLGPSGDFRRRRDDYDPQTSTLCRGENCGGEGAGQMRSLFEVENIRKSRHACEAANGHKCNDLAHAQELLSGNSASWISTP